MKWLRGSRGSTMVEAAMVFPLVILIVCGIILTGLQMYGHVSRDASDHSSKAIKDYGVGAEDILRGKWTLRGSGEDTDENVQTER